MIIKLNKNFSLSHQYWTNSNTKWIYYKNNELLFDFNCGDGIDNIRPVSDNWFVNSFSLSCGYIK